MTRPLLPPKGVFIGSRVVYDPGLPAPVKETLLQLMALTWPSHSHCTPPLTYALLTHLTGKSARTLRGHFSMLGHYHAVLRLQRAGTGQFMLVLADGLFDNRIDLPAGGETLPEPYHDHSQEEDEMVNLTDTFPEELLPHPHDQEREETPGQHGAGQAAGDPPAPGRLKLKKAFVRRMEDAGVFSHLFDEVAECAVKGKYTHNQLEALLDWCVAENNDRPGGLFIYRLRKGVHAPGRLEAPPCPRCGKRGKHAPDCPRRYQLDEL